MLREIDELAVAQIRAYYRLSELLDEMKDNALSIAVKIGDNVSSTKAIVGNARYQNKVDDYIEFENLLNEKLVAVKAAMQKLDDDVAEAAIKSIATGKYVPCISARELAEAEAALINNVAVNLLGSSLYEKIHRS
ncbi:MAG: hypothetical protein SPI74_00505 [Eubacterium sp.]|nr:hypothetical protein [Eubacterium sp.]